MVEFLALFQSHGLIGLVVGALLFLILVFINVLERRAKQHNTMVQELLIDSRKEREGTNDRFAKSTDRLSDALIGLTDSLRGTK